MLQRSVALGKLHAVVLALLLASGQGVLAQHQYTLPLVMSGLNSTQQGFVRIINRSDGAGTVAYSRHRRFRPAVSPRLPVD